MNYDVKISQDGCPVIARGDFLPIDFASFIAQKIYKAIMNMPLNIASGIPLARQTELESVVTDYLIIAFQQDRILDPRGLNVSITPSPGDEKALYTISYKGKAPDGTVVEYSSDLAYSVKSGAMSTVDYEPKWLSIPRTMTQKVIQLPKSVNTPVSNLEIPIEPYPWHGNSNNVMDGGNLAMPIYLLTEDQISTIDTSTTVTFTIPLVATRSKYQLSSYIDEYTRRGSIIESYSFDITDITFRVSIEYGEPIIIVEKGTTGDITGSAVLRNAVQCTNSYAVRSPMVASPVFPLRRHRGKYFAIFPKTIQIGDYYLRYTALSEE